MMAIYPDFQRTLRRLSELKDWVAERGGFEPPVPREILWPEFCPLFADYLAQEKAAVLERICSPWIPLLLPDHSRQKYLFFERNLGE
jgi:hypothetical protein